VQRVSLFRIKDDSWTKGAVRRVATVGASLSERLDGIEDSKPVADAGYTDFFEGDLVQFEKDISSDIARSECRRVMTTFDVCEPSGNVRVGPSA
jgi:hypothetical protein